MEFAMRPIYPKRYATNVQWALDVRNLRKLLSDDPQSARIRSQIVALDGETTLTDEERVALDPLGRRTPEGIREFAAERISLLPKFVHRSRAPLRQVSGFHISKKRLKAPQVVDRSFRQ
ncbi:MAG: hypothetical protein WA823_11685 [Candidatus Acidiferrales bacterium]